MSAQPKQRVDFKDNEEKYAYFRRMNHGNQEAMQNYVISCIAQKVAVYSEKEDRMVPLEMPPRVRHLISAIQGAHGGGVIKFEEFERDYLSIGKQLQFTGNDDAIRSRVRDWIDALIEWQFAVGYELITVRKGGKIVGYTPDNRPICTKTVFIDHLKPLCDEAVQRARFSQEWKEHPGKAMAAQAESVADALPKLGTRDESNVKEKGEGSPEPVDKYEMKRASRICNMVEEVADKIDLKGGDSELWLEDLESKIRNIRSSRKKIAPARQDYASVTAVEEGTDIGMAGLSDLPQILEEAKRAHAGGNNNTCNLDDASDLPAEASETLGEKNLTQENIGVFEENEPEALAYALQFAGQGLAVLPLWGVMDGICDCPNGSECRSAGKHPHSQLAPRGVYSAIWDEKVIRSWFKKEPNINLGLAMGGPLNLVCVDVDPRNDGDATYHDLIEHYGDAAFPETYTQRTGGNGWHKVYRLPEEIAPQKGELKAKLGPGVDVKGVGGLIVAAPSMHSSGRRYEVEVNTYIAFAPKWLISALKKSAEGEQADVVSFQAHRDRKQSATGFGRYFEEGERNDGLRDVCCGRWVHGYAVDAQDLYEQMVEVRDTRCAPGKDAPATNAELWDLVQRTVKKYARGELRGGEGVA